MGVPTSKVGCTSAITRRGDHDVYMDLWWYWDVMGLSLIISWCICNFTYGKGKDLPLQALRVPGGCGSQILAHEGGKVSSPTHRPPLHPRNIPGTHLGKRLSRPQGHSAVGRIMSMKNYSETIGNRTRDLPVCSAVPLNYVYGFKKFI
jgi:hypothetical protein